MSATSLQEIKIAYVDLEKVTHEEVVVHGLCNDLSDRLRRHLDIGVML